MILVCSSREYFYVVTDIVIKRSDLANRHYTTHTIIIKLLLFVHTSRSTRTSTQYNQRILSRHLHDYVIRFYFLEKRFIYVEERSCFRRLLAEKSLSLSYFVDSRLDQKSRLKATTNERRLWHESEILRTDTRAVEFPRAKVTSKFSPPIFMRKRMQVIPPDAKCRARDAECFLYR